MNVILWFTQTCRKNKQRFHMGTNEKCCYCYDPCVLPTGEVVHVSSTTVLIHNNMVSGWADGLRAKLCPGCISDTLRCS